MKKIDLQKKSVLRLFSVIIGIVIWVIIIYTDNYTIDANLGGIDVQVTGESTLMSNRLVLVNRNDIGAGAVSVRGRRSDIIKAMGDVTATVDLSKISEPGLYDIKVNYDLNTSAIYITDKKTVSVQVAVEKMEEKILEVEVVHNGNVPDEEIIIESVPDKNEIVVEGAKADIDKIGHAAVFVDISGMKEDAVGEYAIKLVDSEYRELGFENTVKTDYGNVNVTNIIHKKVTLPVKLVFPEEYGKKYLFETEWKSKKEIVAGVDGDMDISEIKAIIDKEEFSTETKEYTVKLQKEPGVYMETEEVKVLVEPIPIVKKEITVPLEIETDEKNKDKYSVQKDVTLKIQGGEKHINKENITAKVDIKKLEAGMHTVKVEVEFGKSSLSLAEDAYVAVTVL